MNGDLCIDCWVFFFKKVIFMSEGVKWNNLLFFGIKSVLKECLKRRVLIEVVFIFLKGL